PSAETVTGDAAPWRACATRCMRSRAHSVASRSADVSAAPSRRVLTRIVDAESPLGNRDSAAAALAESDEPGNETGDWPAALLSPAKAMRTPETRRIAEASNQERRVVTRAEWRSRSILASLSSN